jgi:hypothetical protein
MYGNNGSKVSKMKNKSNHEERNVYKNLSGTKFKKIKRGNATKYQEVETTS